MIGRTQTEMLLKRVLSLSSVSFADEIEVVLMGLDEQLTRFANNIIHQHVAEANHYVVVRAALGRRVGIAATNNLTDEEDGLASFAHIYDKNGDGVIDSLEAALRAMANDVFSSINEQGDI